MTPNVEQTRSRVAAAHRTALTLVLAFAMSIVIYVGVGILIRGALPPNMRADLRYASYAAAAILAIGSIIVRRTQLHRMKLEVVAARRGVDGLIKHLLNATLLAAAMAEIIGVLALLVAFFGGDRSEIIRLGVVALAVSLYNYPRRSAWQQVVDYYSAANAAAGQSSLGL